MEQSDELRNRLSEAMRRDRHRLARRLCAAEQARSAGTRQRLLREVAWQIEQSIALRQARERSVPPVRFDEDLPIRERLDEIAQAVRAHQVVVVCGETGSGKSTQLPKLLLHLGLGVSAMIGHTQPRRIAARSIATRVAEELGCPLGRQVAFKMRFSDTTGPETLVKVMTDGILLAETQGDRSLWQYEAIILDEAHERSLNVDFLIGYLARLLPQREDLKLVITSATIDPGRFARHFQPICGPVPVIEVSGRSWPVEVRYWPPEPDEETGETDWLRAVADAVEDLAGEGPGDMLVFLPTERDIHQAAKLLRGRTRQGDPRGRPVEVLPLYARLSAADQQRIFRPHSGRRIVLATNVAESSLTVPGIRYVIDLGTARIARYSARSKTQRLPIEAVSQASADQRAGRCGRTGPGICVRLYSEDDYRQRERFTPPEIQRTNLAWVVLQAKALRLGKLEQFPFLDPPRPAVIRDGERTLDELGAVDQRGRLTDVGRQLSRLPVDPRIGRIILAAAEWKCLTEVLVVAAALESQDPRLRPPENAEAADQCHGRLAHPESDFLTYLNLWDFYQKLKTDLSPSRLRKACAQNYLSYNRLRQWADVYVQLLRLVQEAGLRPGPRRGDYEAIHRAILTGLVSHVALRTGTNQYTVAGGSKAYLWPGSVLFEQRPRWIVAAELVETTQRYLRTCARVEIQWIEQAAGHLLKYRYSDPYWSSKTGSAMAYESVSLFGLPLVSRRAVRYGPIHPADARAMLIQHGLVEGQLGTELPFLAHNRGVRRQLDTLRAKLRRELVVSGQWAEFDFYDRRIPRDVVDRSRLVEWLEETEPAGASKLCIAPGDLLGEPLPEDLDRLYPDQLETPAGNLPLEYHFEPGAANDGLTVVVPAAALPHLEEDRLEWLVPGYLEPKVAALVKSLPKALRRRLVPVRETTLALIGRLTFAQGNLREALAAELRRIAGERITAEDFQPDRLPAELRMHIRAVDEQGNLLAEGRCLAELREKLQSHVSREISHLPSDQWNRRGLHQWDWDRLPEQVTVSRGGIRLRAFPAVVDGGDSVALQLADSPEKAAHWTRCGLRRLFIFAARRSLEKQIAWMPNLSRLGVYAAGLPGWDLHEALVTLLAERAFYPAEVLPRTREQFDRACRAGLDRLPAAVQEVATLVGPLLETCHQARLAMEQARLPIAAYAVTDVQEQLAHLTYPGFAGEVPWCWLVHYPRYFRAISVRFDKLRSGGLERDRRNWEEQFAPRWECYCRQAHRHAQQDRYDPQLVLYRWMLEEFRVQLFAQQLGTALPVSPKRLDRQWDRVQK